MFKLFKLKAVEYPIFILWVLIASLYIRPYNGIMAPFYKYGNYLVFLYSYYLVLKKWNCVNKVFKIIYSILVAGVLFLILSRLLNGFGYDNMYSSAYLFDIALINIFSFGLIDNMWVKLKAFSFLLLLYICINFMTIILYPDGLYETDLYLTNWYLGFKNVMVRTMLPGIALNMLCSIHDFGKLNIKDIFLTFISLYSVYLVDSSTSIFILGVYIAGLLLWCFKKAIPSITLFKAFWVVACVSIAFTMFSFQSYLASLIEMLFEKDATFTGRVYVWAFTLVKLLESPIIGFGWHSADEWRSVLGFYGMGFDMGFSHPHNLILYMLLQGGIIYLALFVFLCFYISKHCNRNSSYYYILTIMYLAFFVEGITESLTGAIFLMPLFGLYANFERNKNNG